MEAVLHGIKFKHVSQSVLDLFHKKWIRDCSIRVFINVCLLIVMTAY